MAFLVVNECKEPAEETGSPQCSLNGPVNRHNKSCPGFPLLPGVSAGTSIHSGWGWPRCQIFPVTPAPCSTALTSRIYEGPPGPGLLGLGDGRVFTPRTQTLWHWF